MGQTALLRFRRKAPWGFFSPWKIQRLRPGLNPQTWVPKATTLPPDHRSRYIGCIIWAVSLLCPRGLSPTSCSVVLLPCPYTKKINSVSSPLLNISNCLSGNTMTQVCKHFLRMYGPFQNSRRREGYMCSILHWGHTKLWVATTESQWTVAFTVWPLHTFILYICSPTRYTMWS